MKTPSQMPAELASKLEKFEQRLRRMEIWIAGLAAVAGMLGTLTVLALLDRLLDTPVWMRVGLTVTGALVVGASGLWLARHWLWRRRDVRDLAKLVQRHYPRLGDRLLGAVELSEGGANLNASPALVRAALRQVDEESRSYDFSGATPKRAARRYGISVILLVALLGAGLALAPEAVWRSLQRWIHPAAPVERYTFARIGDLPPDLYVPHGEPFELGCAVDAQARWQPSSAEARIERQPIVRSPVRQHQVLFRFPGQTTPGIMTLRVGDVRRTLMIHPELRPELEELTAHIRWPDYLGRTSTVQRVEQGHLAVMPGAAISLVGTASRALGWVRLAGNEANETESADIQQAHFTTRERPLAGWMKQFPGVATNSARVIFCWADLRGMTNAQPYRLEINVAEDMPPKVEGAGVQGSVAVLEDEVLSFTVRATDDFGLARIATEWSISNREAPETPAQEAPVKRRVLAEGGREIIKLEGSQRLSPRIMGAKPGQVITLWATGSDYCPGRDPTRDGPYTVYVLSAEEHQKLVQDQLREISARLEEAIREEERLLSENAALQGLKDDELANDPATEALRRGEEGERMNTATVEALAKQMEDLIKEAMRNPRSTAEEMTDWTRAAENMKDAAKNPMSGAASKMNSSQQNQNSRRNDLKEAMQDEQKAIEQLSETSRELSESMDRSTARNFINRLKEAAKLERAVADTMQRLLPMYIGLTAAELNPAQRATLSVPRRDHETNRKEGQYIRDDLGSFYARTRTEIYDTLRQAMTEPDVLLRFDDILSSMDLLRMGETQQKAIALAVKYEEWAAQLEAAGQPPPPPGEGAGQPPGPGLEPEVMMGMMRARVLQEMLREQTRAAEENHQDAEYRPLAERISGKQQELSKDFTALSEKTKVEQAAKLLRELSGTSDETVEMLGVPNTGPDTVAAQTEIIEAIAASLQGQKPQPQPGEGEGQPQPGQQPGQQEGEGQGQGKKGGGSTQGGEPDTVSQHSGPGGGKAGEGKDAARGGGADPATWPAEYRDAIQQYYESLEGRK